MKTVLITIGITLGVVFLIAVGTVGGIFAYGAYTGGQLDSSSKAYVDEAVPAIITNWSKDELISRESPQLHEKVADEQIVTLFTKVGSQLGTFKSYDGSKGEANISMTIQNGKVITAAYVAHATFEKGKIDLDVKLIQVDGRWRLLGFHIAPHSES